MSKVEGAIEKLFAHQDAITRHLAAPMLPERQAYLGKLLAAGYKRQFVKDRASTLCHIVNRGWFVLDKVTDEDILVALIEWLGEKAPEDLKTLDIAGETSSLPHGTGQSTLILTAGHHLRKSDLSGSYTNPLDGYATMWGFSTPPSSLVLPN